VDAAVVERAPPFTEEPLHLGAGVVGEFVLQGAEDHDREPTGLVEQADADHPQFIGLPADQRLVAGLDGRLQIGLRLAQGRPVLGLPRLLNDLFDRFQGEPGLIDDLRQL
jgi:hypothetical protein